MLTSSAPQWVREAIFYQIFPERFRNGDLANDPPGVVPWDSSPTRENFFGGDLQGLIDSLPYLEDLGITALYLTPVFKARTNHKYDTCDYFEIDPAFGTNELFGQFVGQAHTRGIRVVLDAVFNHCGDGFGPFEDLVRCGASSQYKNWFFPASFPLRQQPLNYQTCGGAVYLPKLNTANEEVVKYLLRVSRFWIEKYGIDGWRLDVPWKVPFDFWRRFREVVKQANPQAYIVGEVWRDPTPWLQGDTCDGVMNYPLRDYLLDYCVRDYMDAEDFEYFSGRLFSTLGSSSTQNLTLLGSHDTPRLLTLCGDVRRATLAAIMQFTLPGVPMVYYGDEVGMQGDNDPGCRAGMRWDERSWNHPLFDTFRTLIRARRAYPALRSASTEKLLTLNGVYAYRRYCQNEDAVVMINPREKQEHLSVPVSGALHTQYQDLFTGRKFSVENGALTLDTLPEKSGLILIGSKKVPS